MALPLALQMVAVAVAVVVWMEGLVAALGVLLPPAAEMMMAALKAVSELVTGPVTASHQATETVRVTVLVQVPVMAAGPITEIHRATVAVA